MLGFSSKWEKEINSVPIILKKYIQDFNRRSSITQVNNHEVNQMLALNFLCTFNSRTLCCVFGFREENWAGSKEEQGYKLKWK